MAKNIIKPLKELTVAAKEIANGNLDVALTCTSKDEVGILTESIQETAQQLKRRIDYINSLAYMDKLTGIKNNTAYLKEVVEIKEKYPQGAKGFTIFVADVNGLKVINDTYGHEYGNELLISAAEVLRRVFGEDEVYRIGGDEFAAICRNLSTQECKQRQSALEEELKQFDGRVRPAIAMGYSDWKERETYEDVFKRADNSMYLKKDEMKARGENSQVVE